MRTELSGYDSPGDIFHVYRIYFFIIAVSYRQVRWYCSRQLLTAPLYHRSHILSSYSTGYQISTMSILWSYAPKLRANPGGIYRSSQCFSPPGKLDHSKLRKPHWLMRCHYLFRYLTLGWCTFVVATWASVSFNNSVCSWFQYYPYGYSIVALPAHMLMILRFVSRMRC